MKRMLKDGHVVDTQSIIGIIVVEMLLLLMFLLCAELLCSYSTTSEVYCIIVMFLLPAPCIIIYESLSLEPLFFCAPLHITGARRL